MNSEALNQWLDELIADVEFEPLKEFLEKLKDPESKEDE